MTLRICEWYKGSTHIWHSEAVSHSATCSTNLRASRGAVMLDDEEIHVLHDTYESVSGNSAMETFRLHPFTHLAEHLLCSRESSPHSTIYTYTIHTPCRGSACWWNFSHCNEPLSTIHEWSWLLPLGRGRLFVLHKTHPDPILIRSSVFRMPGAPLSTINLQLPCLLLQKHVMITSTITCRQAISFQVEHAQTGCFWGVHI